MNCGSRRRSLLTSVRHMFMNSCEKLFCLFLAGSLVLSAAEPDGCKLCDANRRSVLSGTSVLLHFLTWYTLPDPTAAKELAEPPDEPLILKLTVNSLGVPCSVAVEQPSARFSQLSDVIVTSVQAWRFKAPTIKGVPQCMKSRLYFYARKKNGRVVLLVPHLTDSADHPYLEVKH